MSASLRSPSSTSSSARNAKGRSNTASQNLSSFADTDRLRFPIRDEIPIMLIEEALPL